MKKIGNKRGAILSPETLRLWIKAGGRCEICNKYLLQDDLTTYTLNLAERAHIVGATKGKKSPRSKSALSTYDRNKEENLLLLCRDHHKVIDTVLQRYTIRELKSIKSNHERRIKFLTGMTDDRKSVVLRMMNNIKGQSITISDAEVREAMINCERRYPDYLLRAENNIEINLKYLPEPVSVAYWKIGKQKIDSVIEKQVEPQTDEKVIKHISIFAIARIPLLIYLGYRLGDKIPIDTYQKQRSSKENWIWCNNEKAITFTFRKIQRGKNAIKVALLASVSGKVHKESLPSFVDSDYTLYEIMPVKEIPNRDIIQNKKTLFNFRAIYQKLLRTIEREHEKLNELLLFPALPLSAAIHCGRELLKDTSPTLVIFDREKGNYIKTITISMKRGQK